MSAIRYRIASVGRRELPAELCETTEDDAEVALRRVAEHLGYPAAEVAVDRVASVLAGSCVACVDVVLTLQGTRMLVASPALY